MLKKLLEKDTENGVHIFSRSICMETRCQIVPTDSTREKVHPWVDREGGESPREEVGREWGCTQTAVLEKRLTLPSPRVATFCAFSVVTWSAPLEQAGS